MEKCLYTITTDSQPIIDRWGTNVVLGCGFSGSGFKNSPAWGKMLACLALGKDEEIVEGFQLDNYSLKRFDWNIHKSCMNCYCTPDSWLKPQTTKALAVCAQTYSTHSNSNCAPFEGI